MITQYFKDPTRRWLLSLLMMLAMMVGSLPAQAKLRPSPESDEFADVKAEIIRIKNDTTYISTEKTAESRYEAHKLALTELLWLISLDYVADSLSTQQLMQYSNLLSHPRGDMVRAFVYISREDLDQLGIPKIEGDSVVTFYVDTEVDPIETEEESEEDEDAELLTDEENAAETESEQIETAIDAESEVAADVDNLTIVLTENAEGQDTETETEDEAPVSLSEPDAAPMMTLPDLADMLVYLMNVEMIPDAELKIEEEREKGTISSHAQVHGPHDFPKNCYLLMFNKDGQIVDLLEVNGEQLRKLSTNKSVTFDDYKGCMGYWFE